MAESHQLPAGVGLTALAVAEARARETARPDRLFEDPFAQRFVDAAGADFAPIVAAGSFDIRALRAEFVAVRTRFFDDALLEAAAAGCRQLVLLAAGLDARAFRLDWPAGTRLFELDAPDVLAFKQAVLSSQSAAPRCDRRVIEVDLREDWRSALLAAGFRAHEPTAWLAEGLLMYLSEPERDALFARIGSLSAPGSRIALDPAVWQVSQDVVDAIARGVLDRSTLATAATAATAADPAKADPSALDPDAWLRRHGWQPTIYDAAERFATYGRGSVPVPATPRRTIATAVRARARPPSLGAPGAVKQSSPRGRP
jgi:methyltransferase (TIGR00027 family)